VRRTLATVGVNEDAFLVLGTTAAMAHPPAAGPRPHPGRVPTGWAARSCCARPAPSSRPPAPLMGAPCSRRCGRSGFPASAPTSTFPGGTPPTKPPAPPALPYRAIWSWAPMRRATAAATTNPAHCRRLAACGPWPPAQSVGQPPRVSTILSRRPPPVPPAGAEPATDRAMYYQS
jgi:hypothetical protein